MKKNVKETILMFTPLTEESQYICGCGCSQFFVVRKQWLLQNGDDDEEVNIRCTKCAAVYRIADRLRLDWLKCKV